MNNIYSTISNRIFSQKFVVNKLITPPVGFVKFDPRDIQQSIPSRFEQQVNQYPNAIAIKTCTTSLTYQQLNYHSNKLANSVLTQRGTQLEVIAVLLEKGADFITTIFGVLKTGKIVVPMDTTFPVDRLAYILADSQAVAIITNNQNLALAKELVGDNLQIFNIDENCHHISTANPQIHILPENPAYIIYTSGSTGNPKGVVQSHVNSLHYCMTDTNTLLISPLDRVIFLYSCSTLGGLLCIFYTLLNGASLYSYDVKKEGLNNLQPWLISEKITIYHSFTTLFRHFVETLTDRELFPKIRLVKLGGEATLVRDVESYQKYFADNCILYASLGATEAGTFRNYLMDKNTKISGSNVPIGYGVEGMDVVILDDEGTELAKGKIGEIAVKSKYLALGYWQKPELTQAVFTPDRQDKNYPENYNQENYNQENYKIYRTGDLGYIEADGCLVHVGRKDFQVKIRGFRIEVSEIEMVLFQNGNFKEVVVIAREDVSGDKRLVAYLVAKHQHTPTIKEIREYLQGKLPEYMIPSHFVFLDALPLTPNGKTDRRSLPAPELVPSEITTNFVEPIDNIESQLRQIWEEILRVKPIGREDNFFDLGGNSLLAVRLFAAIEQKFGKQLPLASLFPVATIAAIAHIIRQDTNVVNSLSTKSHNSSSNSSIVPIQPQGKKPPLFLIHSLGGELLCYRHLAIHLGTEQPVYGLQPQGIDGTQPPLIKIEDMAIHYIREIKTVQPQGPYLLGGYSFGGVVAYEIARQLEKQGEKVKCLVLLDSIRPGYSQRLTIIKRIPLHLKNILKHGHHYLLKKGLSWLRHAKYSLKQEYKKYLKLTIAFLKIPVSLQPKDRHLQIMESNTQALQNYSFPIYSGTVTLLRTKDENRGKDTGTKYDSQFGWGEIVIGKLDTYYIPGSHLSLLDEPYVREIAIQLKECLENC